jgi:hypothetical protein
VVVDEGDVPDARRRRGIEHAQREIPLESSFESLADTPRFTRKLRAVCGQVTEQVRPEEKVVSQSGLKYGLERRPLRSISSSSE